jgi:hypothetical protein|tara:strand:+ start:1145 stop:1582 length:438 start_codon:yes stop_codon:yes gene_type:complete
MTNASVYVYDTVKDYMTFYPNGQDVIREEHLSGIWINEKSVVFVSGEDAREAQGKPDFSKSLVYYDGGEKSFEKYVDNFEHVVEICVDPKTNSVIFSGQEIQQKLAIARKLPREFKNKKLTKISGYILYDKVTSRLNLIINPVKH